jgi:hypothetical protein
LSELYICNLLTETAGREERLLHTSKVKAGGKEGRREGGKEGRREGGKEGRREG